MFDEADRMLDDGFEGINKIIVEKIQDLVGHTGSQKHSCMPAQLHASPFLQPAPSQTSAAFSSTPLVECVRTEEDATGWQHASRMHPDMHKASTRCHACVCPLFSCLRGQWSVVVGCSRLRRPEHTVVSSVASRSHP